MSIADKLTYLQTTKQLLKTEINKINNVLTDESTFRSYPQELFNGYLDVLNNGTDTLWNNLEKVSASGEEATLENVETAPIKMVLNGNTSQDGEPTPDTPVEVKVVKGENVVSVSGKNLFDKDNANVLNAYISNSGVIISGTSNRVVWLKLKPNTTYTLSLTKKDDNGDKVLFGNDDVVYGFINVIPTINTQLNDRVIINNATSRLERTFTTDSTNIYIAIKVVNITKASYENTINTLQLEEGSTATPYVPYSKTDYPISLGTLELCKIGDYQDYLYKNNGKWYVHKEIGKVVLDGSESGWKKRGSSTNSYIIIQRSFQVGGNICMSDKFIYSGSYDGQFEHILVNSSWNENLITIDTSRLTENSLNGAKQWLSTNQPNMYYPLATPTEEEITNTTLIEQLEAISKAKSVKDKTYITQTNDELPFILDVEAIKEYEVN